MLLLQWNCRDFYARIEEIKQLISFLHPLILCLQEIHFRPTDNSMLRGYDVYRTDKLFFDRASGVCDLCDAPLNVYHILVECRKYAPIRLALNFNGDLRFLLRDSDDGLLILEESLETLSPAVEERIHSSVKDYFSSSTVIIIAHRLQFVKNCDKVMAILNGKQKPGRVQMRDRGLVRAKTNKLGTGSGKLAPSLVGWKCEGWGR
uniref:Uncharacterized protein n=1 Tax=Timema tahoe TaxID=61484 RepID=A0A7R9IHI8_9NEOP|nr:unnamed protein product [Timema tahoe]